MKKMTGELFVTVAAMCSAVALFADVESTGNLSMALNGAGIPQLIGFVFLIMGYRKIMIEKNMLHGMTPREKAWYGITAVLFSVFMIIGKAQTANEDLKYGYLAVVLFMGYFPLFYVLVSLTGKQLETMSRKSAGKQPGKVTEWLFERHVISGVMMTVFLFRLPYLIAFFPCSMTWDGGVQICSLYGSETFTNHHPPLLSFFYGAVAKYSQEWNIPNIGMFAIPLVQTTLSAFAAAKVCELFRYLKTPYWIRWGSLLYYAAFTVWCIFDCTVIKDTLYYPLTMLFLVQIIYCILQKEAFFQGKSNLIKLLVYGVLITQVRNNGIFVLIFVLPVAFLLVSNRRKLVFGAAVILTFLLSFALDNWVWPAFGVTKLAVKEDTYCILFQQTAKYGQDYPDDVTAEERAFLDTLFDYDELTEAYNPYLADWVKNCLRISEASSADNTNREFAAVRNQYFRVWFAQFLRHPVSYAETFFECSYGYYYPELRPYKEGMGFYEEERYVFSEGMHAYRQIGQLAPARFLLEQFSKAEYLPGIGLLYRCGFYTWCVVFAVIYLIVRRRYRDIVMTLPAVVNILVCLLSPVNTCTRYAMPTMCMIPVILAVIWNVPPNTVHERA